eukprot:snap_masked-scaffold_56-processed-gene-1.6-mRNA-1 protein AED:1.00 eAED:1.00 QI:0/-1/0/0/-1/1/1/0/406
MQILLNQSKDNDKSSKATTLDPSRHSLNDDAETRSQVTTLTRRSKASKVSGRSEVSRAKSDRSRATDVSKTFRKPKYSQPSLKGDKNSSTTLSIDPWSRTGSTYVDKKFHTRNYEPRYLPTSSFPPTTRGYPLVHIQPPNKLTALTVEKIKAFVHEVETTLPNVPMNVLSLISSSVTESLQQRRVNTNESQSIIIYLKKHLQNYYKAERSRSISQLQTVLKWPMKNMLPEDQIYTFIDNAMKILKLLDKDKMNRNRKKILKTILSKVPETFNFNVDEMLLDVKELNLPKLRSKMMKRRFVLRVKVNKTKQVSGLKTSHLHLYQHEGDRKRKQFKKVGCIILRRIGKEATPINLMLFHLANKQYIQVNGIADTGANYNVSSIQALKDFTIKTKDPQYIKEVQFPDKF